MIRFTAHFDGQNLSPDEPVSLPTDRPLQVTVEAMAAQDETPALDKGGAQFGRFLDGLEATGGLFDGPEDMSAQLDFYLYGGSKRSSG